jgi:hypothetical protein
MHLFDQSLKKLIIGNLTSVLWADRFPNPEVWNLGVRLRWWRSGA